MTHQTDFDTTKLLFSTGKRMRIFTWHIHGSYLFYLSQGNYDIFIPVNNQKSDRYCGRGNTFPFGSNVIEVKAEEVKNLEFDVLLFQADENYFVDQYEILSEAQRALPKVYLEHDPPWGHPTNEVHPVKNNDVTLVHVTHFNKLMWHSLVPDVRVIEHGVMPATASYTGELNKGIVVINNLPQRGRLLGFDLFEKVQKEVPVDLVGMGTKGFGLGEVLHPQLPEFISRYRFFFNPIRYTSLGLAVCEAMTIGMPIVGLATTEMPNVIKNGYNGYVHTDVSFLIDFMNMLIENKTKALELGANAKQYAEQRFDIKRFTRDWEELFSEVSVSKQASFQ